MLVLERDIDIASSTVTTLMTTDINLGTLGLDLGVLAVVCVLLLIVCCPGLPGELALLCAPLCPRRCRLFSCCVPHDLLLPTSVERSDERRAMPKRSATFNAATRQGRVSRENGASIIATPPSTAATSAASPSPAQSAPIAPAAAAACEAPHGIGSSQASPPTAFIPFARTPAVGITNQPAKEPATIGALEGYFGAAALAPAAAAAATLAGGASSTDASAGGAAAPRQLLVRDATVENLAGVLTAQKETRIKSAKRRQDDERTRKKRLLAFDAKCETLWKTQWQHVQLHSLPFDTQVDGRGVAEREPFLSEDLADLLREQFQALFDVYLYYAKVDAEASASELYRMTDPSWRMFLRDATVMGNGPNQLRTMAATQIFRTVNQRRDNLSRGTTGQPGTYHDPRSSSHAPGGSPAPASPFALAPRPRPSPSPLALAPRPRPHSRPHSRPHARPRSLLRPGTPKRADGGTSAAITSAVLQVTEPAAVSATVGFNSSVTMRHYAAGSLFAFTFSEFLEGLVFAALHCYPPSPAAAAAAAAAAEARPTSLPSSAEQQVGLGMAAAPAASVQDEWYRRMYQLPAVPTPEAPESAALIEARAAEAEGARATAASPPTTPLTAAQVLTSVSRLLGEKVLPNAKHGDVLEFRRKITGSSLLTEAFDALRHLTDPLYTRYSKDIKAANMSSPFKVIVAAAGGVAAPSERRPSDGGGGTLSLKRFLDLCQDASLIGTQLSRNAVKTAFVHSLQFSADTAAVRKPLLTRGDEFDEALIRLAYAYEAPSGGVEFASPIGNTRKGKAQNRFSTLSVASAAASSVSAAVKGAIGSRRDAPPEAGSADAEAAEIEAEVLAKLPLVLGKLIAVLADDASSPGSLMA